MTASSNVAVSVFVSLGLVVAALEGFRALYPIVPSNMPSDAHFVQSGYDLAHNDPEGNWIACRVDAEQNTDFCRVTDPHGFVIFEGDFLPLDSLVPVAAVNLRFAEHDPGHLWVKGPAEGGPVPVIPLADGQLLVPAADSQALADRWAKDPDELVRLELR
jgi:hypothetical protein